MSFRKYLHIFFALCLCFTGFHCICHSPGDFYSSRGSWDLYRLPLLEPYAVTSATKGSWSFDEHSKSIIPMEYAGGSVEKVNVSKNFLYGFSHLYSTTDSAGNWDTVYAYFVIPDTSVLKDGQPFFSNSWRDYSNKLITCGVDVQSGYSPKALYKEFAKTGKLPWRP